MYFYMGLVAVVVWLILAMIVVVDDFDSGFVDVFGFFFFLCCVVVAKVEWWL